MKESSLVFDVVRPYAAGSRPLDPKHKAFQRLRVFSRMFSKVYPKHRNPKRGP